MKLLNFLRKYKYILIILVFFLILYITYNRYQRTKTKIRSNYETQHRMVENNIINTLESAYGAYSISEKLLNNEMREYSYKLVERYKNNPNIKEWDLSEIKQEMQIKDYEIYVINSDLKVIKTTFKKDLGLDFTKYPSFSKLLKKRLKGDSFVSDKMDIATNTGQLKKYSYIPTPDNKYLLELSIDVGEKFSLLNDLNIYSMAQNLENKYEFVQEISFYKFNQGANSVGKIEPKPDPINTNIPNQVKKLVKKAVLSKSAQSSLNQNTELEIENKYVPFLFKNKEGDNDWWNSFVVGISYNNQEMIKELRRETQLFIINILIIAVVFTLFIIVMIFLLKKTEHMAYHDHLTGLPNRKAFENYFTKIRKESKNKINKKIALLYIDMDSFKNINDTYGHEVGDKILKDIGDNLSHLVRQKDKVSRVGGDEFVILLTDINAKDDVFQVINKLKDNATGIYEIDEYSVKVDFSVGYSIFPENGESLDQLMKKADFSMYQAKENNNNC